MCWIDGLGNRCCVKSFYGMVNVCGETPRAFFACGGGRSWGVDGAERRTSNDEAQVQSRKRIERPKRKDSGTGVRLISRVFSTLSLSLSVPVSASAYVLVLLFAMPPSSFRPVPPSTTQPHPGARRAVQGRVQQQQQRRRRRRDRTLPPVPGREGAVAPRCPRERGGRRPRPGDVLDHRERPGQGVAAGESCRGHCCAERGKGGGDRCVAMLCHRRKPQEICVLVDEGRLRVGVSVGFAPRRHKAAAISCVRTLARP